MSIIAAVAFLYVQDAALPDDRQTLSAYFQHSCRLQQVDRNGGAGALEDHAEFCNCFEIEVSAGASDEVFRIYALGGQGALQDRSMAPDWQAARDEAVRLYETLTPEAQASLQSNMQAAFYTCLGE